MIRQSEKDPSLKICLTPYGPDGKAGDEICQPLAFSQLTSGNLGSTAFILPLDTARYVLKVNKHRPSSDSGFKIEVGNPGK